MISYENILLDILHQSNANPSIFTDMITVVGYLLKALVLDLLKR